MPIGFKVLRADLTSVGLLGAKQMQYQFDIWNMPSEPISDHPRKGGGLWVAPTKSDARSFQKYVFRKYGIATRIFRCEIGKIIYRTSCRIKTDKLFFRVEDEIVD